MSGLTVIGDIQVLYDSVKNLETELKDAQLNVEKKYDTILTDICQRLFLLENEVYGYKILRLPDTSWENVRAKRDYLLKSTDWTAVNGCTVSPLEWAEYRQYLRDLPQTFSGASPQEVVWPEQPSTLGPHTIETQEES